MNLSELKNELLEGKLRSSYIFTGDELALQDVYINKIAEIAMTNTVFVDTLADVYTRLNTRTLVKSNPSIYIIRDDEDYRKREDCWGDFIDLKSKNGSIVIMRYSSMDKRGKFYKAHEPILTEFNFVDASVLKNRLHAVTKLPEHYCEEIVRICGCNYGRIQHELYKLNVFAKVNGYSLLTAYLEARKQNMIHEEIGDVIFDFSNAVLDRDYNLAYKYLTHLKTTDEGPIKLLSVLYNSFRNVLLVQSTASSDQNEAVLGLTSAQIFVTKPHCDKYALSELVAIVKLIREVERGIKIGMIDSNFAMEYLLSQII